MDAIVLVIVAAIIVEVMIWLRWPKTIGAVWVPTPTKTVHRMLQLAQVHEGDMVIDLGSGDGRIIISAAKDYRAKALGIEADPIRVLWSRWNIQHNRLTDRVKVIWGNFFDQDLGEATVVTVYQNPEVNDKLQPKFERELKPGTRIVSHDFIFYSWTCSKMDSESNSYLYIR